MRLLLAGATLLLSLTASAVASAADHVVFQLGWLPGGDRSPVYIGVQEGFFAKENLDVKILTGRGATDVVTKLATGVADFGEAGLDSVLAAKAAGPTPITAVMAYFTKPPDALLTSTASGITSLKDAVGKKVATSPFTSSNLAWPLVLTANGVDPGSVELIKVDAAVLGSMLASGKIDAVISWITSVPPIDNMMKDAGKTLRVLPWSQYGYEGYSQCIVASDKALAERPDVARRFLKVMRQSVQFMHDNPQRAAEDVKAIVPDLDITALRAQADVAIQLAFNEVTTHDGLGMFSPERVRQTWDWVSKTNGFPPDKVDPMSAVSTKFLGS
ncbi:MAG: ABC transporter substrate-binding protein [Alphaproteobacteria bacterium]|nr:ABC transporter substrate-binding protein [Alphaproteobacteria bacterium]